MIFCDAYCDRMSRTGRIRYAPASCHPTGGCPSSNGNSHDSPDPPCRSIADTGPLNVGIQKKPSFSSPWSAALVRAR